MTSDITVQAHGAPLGSQDTSHPVEEKVMALDLEPDEIYSRALKVVQRAERKLWLLRLKIHMRRAHQKLRDFWVLA
jgi:hypothetical protein